MDTRPKILPAKRPRKLEMMTPGEIEEFAKMIEWLKAENLAVIYPLKGPPEFFRKERP